MQQDNKTINDKSHFALKEWGGQLYPLVKRKKALRILMNARFAPRDIRTDWETGTEFHTALRNMIKK